MVVVVVIIAGKKCTMQDDMCILVHITVIFLALNQYINIFVLYYLEGMMNLIDVNVLE